MPAPPWTAADDEAAAAAEATAREWLACINADDNLRIAALMTDAALARFFAGALVAEEQLEEAQARLTEEPAPRAEEERARLLSVSDVAVLEDGRIVALAVINEPALRPRGQETLLLVFDPIGRPLPDRRHRPVQHRSPAGRHAGGRHAGGRYAAAVSQQVRRPRGSQDEPEAPHLAPPARVCGHVSKFRTRQASHERCRAIVERGHAGLEVVRVDQPAGGAVEDVAPQVEAEAGTERKGGTPPAATSRIPRGMAAET